MKATVAKITTAASSAPSMVATRGETAPNGRFSIWSMSRMASASQGCKRHLGRKNDTSQGCVLYIHSFCVLSGCGPGPAWRRCATAKGLKRGRQSALPPLLPAAPGLSAKQAGEQVTDPPAARVPMRPVVPILMDLDPRRLARRLNDFEIEIVGKNRGNRHGQRRDRIRMLCNHRRRDEDRNTAQDIIGRNGRFDRALRQSEGMARPHRRGENVPLGREFTQRRRDRQVWKAAIDDAY